MNEIKHDGLTLKIADHVVMSRTGNDLLFASDVIVKLPDCSSECLALAGALRNGLCTVDIRTTFFDVDCKEMVDILSRLNFLVAHVENPWPNEAFSSHFSYFVGLGLDPIAAQLALINAHVVILGVGGTGAAVLQHLVGSGVQTYTLIDADIVELKNLNRQFIYRSMDVGKSKVLCASDYITERCPNAKITTYQTMVESSADLQLLNMHKPVSMFLNAADYPACAVVEAVAEFCRSIGSPFLSGGCGFLDGHFGPLVGTEDNESFLHSYYSSIEHAKAVGGVIEPIQPISFGPLNTVVGAMMARDIIDHLAGGQPISRGHRIRIDLRRSIISRWPVGNLGGTQQ
jgi:sulfur-carrier protein adenylyltransferase/sulfurtransferase